MSFLSALRESAAPAVAVEIASARVSAATLEWRGGQPVVAAHASEPLPEGALVPSLTAANAVDAAAVTGALSRLLEKIGRPRRIGLILPDVVAKVSIVRFEQVPAKTQDLDQLVRWQVRKSAPFAIEDAQVSYVPGTPGRRRPRVRRDARQARASSRSTSSCAPRPAPTPGWSISRRST